VPPGRILRQNEIPRVAGQHPEYVIKQLKASRRAAHQRCRQHDQRRTDHHRAGHRGSRALHLDRIREALDAKRNFTRVSLILTLAVPCSLEAPPAPRTRGAARDARHRSDRHHALPGFGVPAAQVPANVQAVTGEEIARQHPLNLPEFMSRRLSGVNVNENQSNPFQPDVTYRGSALRLCVGTPQGISVYQDGVRINEPFGTR